jgi:hypothetical protein
MCAWLAKKSQRRRAFSPDAASRKKCADIDRFRRELGTDYLDIVLLPA